MSISKLQELQYMLQDEIEKNKIAKNDIDFELQMLAKQRESLKELWKDHDAARSSVLNGLTGLSLILEYISSCQMIEMERIKHDELALVQASNQQRNDHINNNSILNVINERINIIQEAKENNFASWLQQNSVLDLIRDKEAKEMFDELKKTSHKEVNHEWKHHA